LGDREPTFEDFDSLDRVLACVYEGLRLNPAGYLLARIASKNTSLTLPRRDNSDVKQVVAIPKGTTVILDMVGMCYDENLFPDPTTFSPRRWPKAVRSASFVPTTQATEAEEVGGTSPATTLEGFLGFSYGPRTCLGKKFSNLESVCFLTLLLREWKVLVELGENESREDWRKRVLEPKFGQALLIGAVPLKLVRRR